MIKIVFSVVLLLTVVSAIGVDVELAFKFKEWMNKNNKTYATTKEYILRQKIFLPTILLEFKIFKANIQKQNGE